MQCLYRFSCTFFTISNYVVEFILLCYFNVRINKNLKDLNRVILTFFPSLNIEKPQLKIESELILNITS